MNEVFEFDPAKSAANLAKHGLDFERAQALWNDDQALEIATRPGPRNEVRWALIGVIGHKHWTAIITYRGAVIRLISVRRSRKEEVELYEQEEL